MPTRGFPKTRFWLRRRGAWRPRQLPTGEAGRNLLGRPRPACRTQASPHRYPKRRHPRARRHRCRSRQSNRPGHRLRGETRLDHGLPEEGVAICDNLLTVPKQCLDPEPVGELGAWKVMELDQALCFALEISF